jgi:3-oxoacyl-[acyl-carrier protein] reductase
MLDQVLQRFGRLDILVNNAGIMTRGPFMDVPHKDYESMWSINVAGTFLCTQYALRPMVKARYGRIINLSSQLARMSVGTGGFAAYAATKGAVEAFTRALAHEVGQHGVTVNAIAPGGIDTDMSKAVMTPEYRERRIKELPVRHLGEVADVAHCAVFLATAESNYLTGQVLQPNGGWVMA